MAATTYNPSPVSVGTCRTGSPTNPFEEELQRFKGQLKNKEKTYFQISNEADFCREIDTLQSKLHGSRRQQNMTKLRGFIEAMVQFGKVIDVYCQTSEIVAFVWGPWKLLLLIGDTFANAFTELLDTYKELGVTLRLLLQARELFEKDDNMGQILVGIYKDVLEFHLQALKYFQQPMLKQLFQATWKTYKTKFSDLIHAMSHHRMLLLGQISLSEARRAREADESRIADQKNERDLRLKRELYGWLQSVNMKNDQHRLQQVTTEHPESGRWIFSKREFRNWFERFPLVPALLWLNGIPGAGKTVLSSLIIEEAKLLRHHPTVLYFYCKAENQEKNNFVAIARSLLLQLLENSPGLLPYFFEKYKLSTEAMLTTIPDIEDLLGTAIKNSDSVYIILDGLDECPRDQRKTISDWFRKLVEELPPSTSDQVRCLFVSQDDGIARKDFSGIASLKIQPDDNRGDICRFSSAWARKLQDRFDLSTDERDEIAAQIPDACNGMFLLAKLICENLFEQLTYDDLKDELEPGNFPKEINDAYDRIMARITSQTSRRGKENHCLKILGWVLCSKRPLRWQEIQAAKSIDLEARTVSMKQRRFRSEAKDICGSMIEVHDEGAIDLVHVTAKLFLIERGYIDPATEDLKLAILCVNYLNLPEIREAAGDIENLITSGYYIFLEYSVLYWVRHLESGLATDKSESFVDDIGESMDSFLDLHWTDPSRHVDISTRSRDGLLKLQNLPCFEDLLQAVVSTRKHLTLFGQMKEDETGLDLFKVLQSVRGRIEGFLFSTHDEKALALVSEMYGSNLFKCSRPSCYHFSAGFPNAALRNIHIEKHLRPYTCIWQGCPTSAIGLTTARGLEKHMRDMHGQETSNTQGEDFPTAAEIVSTLPPHNPSLVPTSTGWQGNIEPHNIEPAPPVAVSRSIKKPKTEHVCHLCFKEYSTPFNLKSHMDSHAAGKMFACEYVQAGSPCQMTFARKSDLKRHGLSHDKESSKHVCHKVTADGQVRGCGKIFARSDTLRSHLASKAGALCRSE